MSAGDRLTVASTWSQSTVYPIVWTGLVVAYVVGLLWIVALIPGIERVFAMLSISGGTALFSIGALVVGGALVRVAPHVATVVGESLDGPDDMVADSVVSTQTGLVCGGLLVAYWGLTPLVSRSLPGAFVWLYHSGVLASVIGLGAYTIWRGRAVLVDRGAASIPPLSRASPASAHLGAESSAATTSAQPRPLTDSERVEQLLAARGGRMRQGEIVDEVDWSASKTSRVIGEMAAEGTVRKLRVGRENLVELVDDQ